MKKICVVTGTRAEYGLLYPIIKNINNSDSLELKIVASTMHLSPEYGLTIEKIEEDGFIVNETVENLLSSNTSSAVCKSTGMALILLSDIYKKIKPDLIVLLGDRFETHAAATCALLMNIPIAHIHGGEVSEGAIDEQIRHSITKMAHMHFTSTEQYRKRIIQMGEDPKNVINSGAPGIDNILHMELLTKKQLEKQLGWKFNEFNILFTYHPETIKNYTVKESIKLILDKLLQLPKSINILMTYANADEGGSIINQELEKFCFKNLDNYKLVKSLGQLKYLSAMKVCDILVGNTSSGIIEAASFNKPVINIGDRQFGRLRSGNVIDCQSENLLDAIKVASSIEFMNKCKTLSNIYGNGNATSIIVKAIENVDFTRLLKKKFYDFKEFE